MENDMSRLRIRMVSAMLGTGTAVVLLGFSISGSVLKQEPQVIQAQDVQFEEVAPFVKMAAAVGDRSRGAHGTFGLFPAGASSPAHTHSGTYHAVVLSGTMTNPFGKEADPPEMTAGSSWTVPAGVPHVTACISPQPCLFYFHADGAFDFAPAP